MKTNFVKQLFVILLSIVLCATEITWAEVTQTTTLSVTNIMKNTVRSDSIVYDLGNSSIGREGGANPPYKQYRSYAVFNSTILGLPADAIVESATLIIEFGAYKPANTAKVVTLGIDPSLNGFATNWSAIGSGTTLVSEVTCSGTQYPVPIDLKKMVQDAVDKDTPIRLGFLSNQEGTDGSTNYLYVGIQATYHTRTFRYFVKNSFNAGTIKVEGITVSSGSVFNWNIGTNHPLEAIDQTAGYYWLWNTSGNARSNWQKRLPNWTIDQDIPSASARNFSYFAVKGDSGGSIIAGMKKLCNVTLYEQTEGGTINAGTQSVVEQNPCTTTAPAQLTVGGFSSQFIGWSDGVTSNPRTDVPSSHVDVTALYKAVHKSNNATAFSNNSQRKLVRTLDGWLHQVYESMGRVWLEHSTNQGTTWFLGNNSQPLDNGEGKCPSIDWFMYGGYNALVVAFQQRNGNTYTIQFSPFRYLYGTYLNASTVYGKSNLLYTETVDPYTTNANPNITRGYGYNDNSFVLTFERKSGSTAGINWFCGKIYDYGFYWNDQFAGPVWISGTNSNSINACVHLNKTNSASGNFDVVFQQFVSGASGSIKDVWLYFYKNGQDQWVTSQLNSPFVISSGTGVSNYKPSMVQMPDCNVRVCWIRSLNGQPQNSPWSVNVVYWNSAAPSQYSIYGWNTRSVSINVRDDNAKTFYTFSQNSMFGQWENYISNGSSYVQLSTAGQDVQLSNGPSSGGNTSMYISSFYPFTLPYYFANAGAIGGQLQKTVPTQMTYGRGAALVKGDLQFSYSLKSLTVDKKNIKFVAIPETPAYKIPDSLSTDLLQARKAMRKWEKENDRYSKLDSLNTVLLSEPFDITDKSSIIFSEQAGFLDTSSAVKALGGNGHITYKLELVDNATNKTIAAIKESKFTSTSLSPCKLSASNLNVNKVGTKTVRVKITISTNITDLQTALVSEFGTVDNIALAKSEVKELTLQAPEIIKEYALEQNYPNPFNPTTTIHYQIPNAGHVTLRIYDILGREVATLVDGMEDMGSYSVTFDGGKLASGVYIMRFIAKSDEGKSFVKTKKLMLLK
jgi:hypothetical protein